MTNAESRLFSFYSGRMDPLQVLSLSAVFFVASVSGVLPFTSGKEHFARWHRFHCYRSGEV